MTQKVKKIKYSSWIPYNDDKMVVTYAQVNNGPVTVVSVDDLEIQRIETHYGEPSEVPIF